MIDIVARRYLFFLISAIIIVPGLVSLVIPPGLQLGVDFTGGTLWEIKFDQPTTAAALTGVLTAHGFGDSEIQAGPNNTFLIRAKEIRPDLPIKGEITADFRSKIGSLTELSFQSVGPTVGNEVWQRSIEAIGLVSVGILFYLWWAFRKVQRSYAYGICAILALLHDAFVVLGVFSILGRIIHVEIDSLFVTALLTVIGFSVHDTIVVFDRVRENSIRHLGEPFTSIMNHSLLQTMGRSLSTSLTVIFTLSALALFGGSSTRLFALALLVGIVSGTYSSIFNASMLLVVWETGEFRRLFRRLRPAGATG
ncbi:MAG TPA: protein translocase subunit SecF [Chloroflexota bacterium]|nr:protein translocase subunit SecF [Chloroflexota bacterium]